MNSEAGMVVVGAGVAGISAACALRDLGYTGSVSVYSAEGVAPYERPALTKAFLADGQAPAPPIIDTRTLVDKGISLELGTSVVAIDALKHVVHTDQGRRITYGRLLLATGARSRQLQIPGVHLLGAQTLRDVADAEALRQRLQPGKRVVLIGGGVLGMEVAASAVVLGCRVTVIEAAGRLLGRAVPEEIAEIVTRAHCSRGVRALVGAKPEAILGDDHVRTVALNNDCYIPADCVVVGVGVEPCTELAADAGLMVDDGVIADAHFRSSDPDIFAAGDVARVFHAGLGRHVRTETWKTAQAQGVAAAASMLDRGKPYEDIPWMWSDQYDLHIQAAGFGDDPEANIVSRGTLDLRTGLTYFSLRGEKLVGACGISIGPGVGKTIRIAQLLMARGEPIASTQLSDTSFDLKALLRAPAGQP